MSLVFYTHTNVFTANMYVSVQRWKPWNFYHFILLKKKSNVWLMKLLYSEKQEQEEWVGEGARVGSRVTGPGQYWHLHYLLSDQCSRGAAD